MRRTIILFATLAWALPVHAQQKPDATGDFVVTQAKTAPWPDAKANVSPAEIKQLQGQTISFRPKEIAGPKQLACKGAHFGLKVYGPDMLFQGTLDKPSKEAADLGFASEKIWTLETGCEIDFHFIDADHALFGLNNTIYTIERKAK